MKKAILLFCLSTVVWAEPTIYSVKFFSNPVPGWSKDRLEGKLLADNSGFTIRDMTPDAAPFDDAETFKIDAPINLPYGDKNMQITVEVDSNIQPLWGNRLMQFQVNGAELDVLVDANGNASFEKDFGDDGKGFVPAASGQYQFALPKELSDFQFLSFMTAGASNFNMTIKDVVIQVWPEEDLRPRPYLLRYNRLGYLIDQPQPVILEWQDDLATDELPFTVRQASHGERDLILKRGEKSSDVGLAITPLDLNLDKPDYTTLIIPETVKRTKHTSILLRTRDSMVEYEKARDEALGAFHWFDMRTYTGAHEQDKQATIFQTTEKKDVYGGWYDAGDYGRYTVNGAWSAYVMLLSYVADKDAFPASISPMNRTDEQRVAFLDVVVPELDFLAKMQRDDGAIYHKVNSRDWPNLTTAPIDDKDEKFILPVSTTATADVAAVMNLAAHIFAQSPLEADQLLAQRYLAVAEKAQKFLAKNKKVIMIQDKYDGYEYGGPYTDSDDSDERLLAAVSEGWKGKKLSSKTKKRLLAKAKSPRLGDTAPDWMNVNFLAVFSALLQPEVDAKFKASLLAAVETEFQRLQTIQAQNPYGLMYAGTDTQFNWGSNGIIATLGTQLLWLDALTDNEAYWQSAYQMSHWFFGLNPHGIIFATGNSRYNVKRPHFRPLVSQAAPQPYGLLSGGPNSVELKGDVAAATLFGKAPMQVFIDHQDSWATNEVAINWQAAWSSYLSLLVKR